MFDDTYGVKWPTGTTQLQREMHFVQHQGHYTKKDGTIVGLGLSEHLHRMRKIIWPELDDEDNGQRWHKICRDTIASHRVTCLMGPGSAGKTHEAAWVALCMWMSDPANTCVMVSSTDMRGLRLRVWGELATLWQTAVQRFDFLPGHMLDSKLAITNDSADDEGDHNDRLIRNFRAAIIGIPTVQNGKNVGLSKWIGLKQKHVILVADEASFMGPSFLSAFANLNKNERFTAIVLGNPQDCLDPLGKAAEPLDGWDGHMEPEKTSVWKTRFMEGACVNLIGTDSPNLDFPEDQPPRFKYLISRKKIQDTLSFFHKDSFEYYSQCVGAMKIGTLSRRVLTRRLCQDNHALECDVLWSDTNRIRVAGLDSAYNGDRCVFVRAEFGKIIGGETILFLHPPQIVPISVKGPEPEQQISEFVKRECEAHNIPPENFTHDSTGRGSLGTFLARVWSAQTNPLEFGGQPSDRPASRDEFILDPVTKASRLRTEKEKFSKKVSALWFSVRYCIEAQQLRGLTDETMEEGCMREWNRVANDKLELENKADCKSRTGRSPDLFDAVAIVVEGARRRGFMISKLANTSESDSHSLDWLLDLSRKTRDMHKSKQLTYR